jgi:hypothetical protein
LPGSIIVHSQPVAFVEFTMYALPNRLGQLHGGEGDEGGEGFREFLEILGETPVGRIGTSHATPATAMHGTEHGGSQNMVRSSPL